MQVIGNPNEALTARGGNALVDDSYYAYTMFRENKGKAAKGTPQNTKGKKKKPGKAQSKGWGDYLEDEAWADVNRTNVPSSREQLEEESPSRGAGLGMTRDLVIDDPDVTTSPMLNPFANIKKKGKKASKTPKSTGTKKKNEVNSEDEAGPDTIDRRTHNINLIRI